MYVVRGHYLTFFEGLSDSTLHYGILDHYSGHFWTSGRSCQHDQYTGIAFRGVHLYSQDLAVGGAQHPVFELFCRDFVEKVAETFRALQEYLDPFGLRQLGEWTWQFLPWGLQIAPSRSCLCTLVPKVGIISVLGTLGLKFCSSDTEYSPF